MHGMVKKTTASVILINSVVAVRISNQQETIESRYRVVLSKVCIALQWL